MDREWEGNGGTNECRPDAMKLDGTAEMGYDESVDYTVAVH